LSQKRVVPSRLVIVSWTYGSPQEGNDSAIGR